MQSEPTAEIAELAPAPERRATANRRTGANSKRWTGGRTTGSEVVKLNSISKETVMCMYTQPRVYTAALAVVLLFR